MSERRYRLAVIAGDGIGPEVVVQALKAVEAAGDRCGFAVETERYDLGGKRYLATGEVLPDSVEQELIGFDAALIGAIGTPDVPPGVLERGLLLRLRFNFDLYVNLRPVKLLPGVVTPIAGLTPDRCDMLVVRGTRRGRTSERAAYSARALPPRWPWRSRSTPASASSGSSGSHSNRPWEGGST